MDNRPLAWIAEIVLRVSSQVGVTLEHNWPFLLLGVLTAAALKVYVGTDRIAVLFRQRTGLAVGGAVTAAVATPFCSCGTTAVVLSMVASSVPWAPVVAFMVASPLTSPDELIVSAGLFGWPFAAFFFASSIVLGLAGGAVALLAELAGLFADQARFAERGCGSRCEVDPPALAGLAHGATSLPPGATSLGPGAASVAEFRPAGVAERWQLDAFARETISLGRRMLILFLGFAAIGYTVIAIVPTPWIAGLLGGSSPISIVLAATLGVPLYVSSEASLPLVASMMHGGMGTGPAMAFLITGAGTSVGAIAGGLLIARWRVLAIVVGTLWAGAIVLGLLAAAIL